MTKHFVVFLSVHSVEHRIWESHGVDFRIFTVPPRSGTTTSLGASTEGAAWGHSMPQNGVLYADVICR